MSLDRFTPKFDSLDPILKKTIIEYAKDNGIYRAGRKYHDRAGMSKSGLTARVKRELEREGKPTVTKIYQSGKQPKKAKRLNKEEKGFLKKLAEGSVSLDEAARMVAVKVFEKMLRFPDSFQFYDFYRVQMLKIKKQESQNKQSRAMELINRLFSGKLPPPNCPKCGTEIFKTTKLESKTIEEGEIVK